MPDASTTSPSRADAGIAVVVPAKDEAAGIAATVAGAATIAEVVVVVDDGSTDDTAETARKAGALVVRHDRNEGKSAAMVSGAEAVHLLDDRDRVARPRHLLFLDGDLGASAAVAAPLTVPVREGRADMTIAVMPAAGSAGGHGFVVRLARDGIRRTTGWTARQPLNGMRCLTREAFDAARPLAHGWGVETALSIDLLRKGFRLEEVDVPLTHRVTQNDWAGYVHRGHQFADVARALAARELAPAALRRWRRVRDTVRSRVPLR